jgi:hypothetical protein
MRIERQRSVPYLRIASLAIDLFVETDENLKKKIVFLNFHVIRKFFVSLNLIFLAMHDGMTYCFLKINDYV